MEFRPDGIDRDEPLRPDAHLVDPLTGEAIHRDPLAHDARHHDERLRRDTTYTEAAHREPHVHAASTDEAWYHKRPPKWVAAPLLLLLVIAGVAAANERHDNWQGANAYDQLPRASVAYQGQVWVPQGGPVLLPDRRMVKVGETVEGHDLYRVSMSGGGGGGNAQPLVSPETVFLRAGQDQYQPMLLRHIGSVGPAIVGPR